MNPDCMTQKRKSSRLTIATAVERISIHSHAPHPRAVAIPELAPCPLAQPQQQIISGCVLAVQDGVEQTVSDVSVEVYAVTPLKIVAQDLSVAVLTHIRALLLEQPKPVELYQSGGYVIDPPCISFADVLRLPDVPGYELLACAARLQPDASFKQLLGNNPAVLRTLLCYYHSRLFAAALAATTMTDALGTFQIAVSQHNDVSEQIGYHFIVRRSIANSFYLALYDPSPAIWHTHWNWPEGKTVTLRTRHPRATCAQLPK